MVGGAAPLESSYCFPPNDVWAMQKEHVQYIANIEPTRMARNCYGSTRCHIIDYTVPHVFSVPPHLGVSFMFSSSPWGPHPPPVHQSGKVLGLPFPSPSGSQLVNSCARFLSFLPPSGAGQLLEEVGKGRPSTFPDQCAREGSSSCCWK